MTEEIQGTLCRSLRARNPVFGRIFAATRRDEVEHTCLTVTQAVKCIRLQRR